MIHWDGVKTERGSRLAGSILGRNVVVHHEAVVHEDAVIGDRTDVAAHAQVSPGARLEPRSFVGPDGCSRDSQHA
jgi:NDP-sugar pyrophosphorylase family protein